MTASQQVSPRRWWNTVGGRTIAVGVAAATMTACVALVVSLPMLQAAAREQARSQLAGLADVAAVTITDPRPGALVGLRALLTGQGIEAYTVLADRPAPAELPPDAVAAVLAGLPVSGTIAVDGTERLLEGRPVGAGGIVLLAPVEVSAQAVVQSLRRLALALVVGLLAAIAVAVAAAKRVTAPLRRVADAAEQLAAGERGVRVQPEGPLEVVEIAEAVNRLSSALQLSEGRQREFLLSVSHELRTPLTAVAGYAEALADSVVDGAEVPRVGELMVGESRRLERLVADLLDLSRLGAADLPIQRSETDLRALITAAAAVWRDRCRRADLHLQLQVPDHCVVIATDADRVRQILDNLAENALRVTPAGGVIVLVLRDQPAGPLIQVRDSGPGLRPEDLADAFEPAVLYTRYRGVRPAGSGVGLALVGRLAARLGGSAKAEGAPEGGACFTVELPWTPPAA